MIKKVILITLFSPLIAVGWICAVITVVIVWVLCKVGVIE